MTSPSFPCDAEGYVRHWLLAGPHEAPYEGPDGSDDAKRRAASDPTIVQPPQDARLGAPGPFGPPWEFYAPGANVFVERSGFWHTLTVLDLYAATELVVPEGGPRTARFWACGAADLWADGVHVTRHDVPRYMYPTATQVNLELPEGRHTLCVRLQSLGVRDTRVLFGLQFLDGADGVLACPPGVTEELVAAERWVQSVRAEGPDALRSDGPAPDRADVTWDGTARPWPAGTSCLALGDEPPHACTVVVEAPGHRFERALEIPANRPAAPPAAPSTRQHRQDCLEHLAASEKVFGVLARRLLGRWKIEDSTLITQTLKGIDERRDCADFTLALLLRLETLGLATGPESGWIRRTALAFRYWQDEPGTDAMCFGSENHSLLFHGCQLIAGLRFPEDRFTNSGHTGEEQARLGRERCLAWLDAVEPHGFREFLSGSYMPITVAALLNLVDFPADRALSGRAARLVDRVFRQLALHAFDGVVIGPQGRVYRNVLTPQASGTQALLSYATSRAAVAHSDWLVFVASSPRYRPPDGLGALLPEPVSTRYRQDGVEIHLHKSAEHLLTSLAIPATFDTSPDDAACPANVRARLHPGTAGYQQHLWQATLGRDCHVFVNHPGCTFDLSSSRPGYWYGNGTLPRMVQREDRVLQIFDIPEEHPVPFTHAHWPSDVFEREDVREHWAFGTHGSGAVGLWCSRPLARHDEMLTRRELRAWGRRVAWLCVCGRADEFESFVESCLTLAPGFDDARRRLTLAGQDGLEWA